MSEQTDDLLAGILESTKTIAIVGASANSSRPSHGVMKYLLENGYTVYAVNPGLAGKEILGQKVYASLAHVLAPCDLVDIFRNSAEAGKICDQAIDLALEKSITVLWMQLGITNNDAAKKAEAAGLIAIEDRCIKVEHQRLIK